MQPRRRPAGVVFCRAGYGGDAISYFDRQTLPVAISAIQQSIPLSNQQFGLLGSAFLVAYAVMYAGGGRMLDLLGTRRGFLLIMLWWSRPARCMGWR